MLIFNQLETYLYLALVLFAIGLYGVLSRRNLIAVLISVELILNAASINFMAFNRFLAPHPAVGQVIALLGRTGSGKTTAVNLIPRFYDVTQGSVCIDGLDVRELELESLRPQIGIVLQESLLFADTIRENIAYGRLDATDDEVVTAAKAARAHDFIMEFPDGYDTEVGERGQQVELGGRHVQFLLVDPHQVSLHVYLDGTMTQQPWVDGGRRRLFCLRIVVE